MTKKEIIQRREEKIAENFRFDYFTEYAKANAFQDYMSKVLDRKLEDCSIYEDDFHIIWHGKELSVPVHPETWNVFYNVMHELMQFWDEMIKEETDFAKDAMMKAVK